MVILFRFVNFMKDTYKLTDSHLLVCKQSKRRLAIQNDYFGPFSPYLEKVLSSREDYGGLSMTSNKAIPDDGFRRYGKDPIRSEVSVGLSVGFQMKNPWMQTRI